MSTCTLVASNNEYLGYYWLAQDKCAKSDNAPNTWEKSTCDGSTAVIKRYSAMGCGAADEITNMTETLPKDTCKIMMGNNSNIIIKECGVVSSGGVITSLSVAVLAAVIAVSALF